MNTLVATEKDIQAAVLQWLNFVPGVVAWRQNTGRFVVAYTSKRTGVTKKRMVRFGEKGQCDVSGMVYGVRLEVEVKPAGKTPRFEQSQWIDMINNHGGIAFWVDSLAMCVEKLRVVFQQRGWLWHTTWEIR